MKKVGLVSLVVGTLSVIMCFSLGFADWTIPISRVEVEGGFTTDDHVPTTVTYNEYLTVTQVTPIKYNSSYGMLNYENDEYGTSTKLTLSAVFDRASAINDGAISSLFSQSKMSLKVSVSFATTPSTISSFTIDDFPIISSGLANITSKSSVIKTNESIYKIWNIGSVAQASSVSFNMSFRLSFSGAVSSLPNFSTNKLTISLLLGEYDNA